jgi:hypothetical protein
MPLTSSLFRPIAFRLACRLVAALSLVTVVVTVFRAQIYHGLLPLFLREIAWLGDDFRLAGIGVRHVGADFYIYLNAGLARPLAGAGKILYPDTGFEMTILTLAGYVIQSIIVFTGLVLAWPAEDWRIWIARLGLAPALLAAALMLDVPLVMLAQLWQGVFEELGDKRFLPLLAWENFLSYGGRLGLALFTGVSCVLLAEKLVASLRATRPAA